MHCYLLNGHHFWSIKGTIITLILLWRQKRLIQIKWKSFCVYTTSNLCWFFFDMKLEIIIYFVFLQRNNLPAVRQYLETFAINIYLKFPSLVRLSSSSFSCCHFSLPLYAMYLQLYIFFSLFWLTDRNQQAQDQRIKYPP